jgi:hypothetical protein
MIHGSLNKDIYMTLYVKASVQEAFINLLLISIAFADVEA